MSPDISVMTLPVVSSRTTVPSGTFKTRSFPFFPAHRLVDDPEIHQGIQAFIDLQVDTAAFTAVTAVGPAGRDIFFPPEGYMSVSSLTAADNYLRFIFKHGFCSLFSFFNEYKTSSDNEKGFRQTGACLKPARHTLFCSFSCLYGMNGSSLSELAKTLKP